jgi:hypothetical protein
MTMSDDQADQGQPPKRLRFLTRKTLIGVGVVCAVCASLFIGIQKAREAARQATCRENLRSIGIALHNYHDIYGCFPPPRITDANGKPLHSWRAVVAPFIFSSRYFDQYDFSEPWNSLRNVAATKQLPSHFFMCPSARQPKGSGFANYVMVVGQNRAARSGQESSFTNHPDAVIVVEIAESDIFWTEPRELNFDEMSILINDRSKPSISSHHAHGAMVVHADGSVHFLDDSTDPKMLKKLLLENLDDAAGRMERERELWLMNHP